MPTRLRVPLAFVAGVAATLLALAVRPGGDLRSQPAREPAAPTTAASPTQPFWRPPAQPAAADGKLRVIAFGAHPDDCELKAAGTAAKWASLGHKVKFVSVTNGDIGHWGMAGGPLAQRRHAEIQETARILGIEGDALDIHDGELLPTLENRKLVTKLIREWRADVVLSHRPNDYHPDHRNVGVLVQDAAYMVTVPHFAPDVPYLEKNPVFLYYEDRFQKPTPFQPDVVVGIDDVIGKKLAAVEALHSQFFEGGANGGPHLVPNRANADAVDARKKEVRESFQRRFASTADRFRLQITERLGAERAKAVKHAEAFEVCEYGRMPSRDELKKLFPFE